MKKNDRKREQSTEAPTSELTQDQLEQVSGGTVNVQHTIVSPRDAASGLPTGKRMHKPFV
jgi:type VI secretion system secreted protein Hcp